MRFKKAGQFIGRPIVTRRQIIIEKIIRIKSQDFLWLRECGFNNYYACPQCGKIHTGNKLKTQEKCIKKYIKNFAQKNWKTYA